MARRLLVACVGSAQQSTLRFVLSTLLCSTGAVGQSYTISTMLTVVPMSSGPTQGYHSIGLGQVKVDAAGNLYYWANNVIYRLSNGVTTTLMANGVPFVPHWANGLGVGAGGVVYVSESDNICDLVKLANGTATTIAGTATSGYNGDNIPATSAWLNYPKGVAEDSKGNVFVADGENNRVRKISNGIIFTLVGPDILNDPLDVAVDSADNVYIAEYQGHRVLKVVNGAVSVFAGTGKAGFGGDGGLANAAQLNYPTSVAADAFGNTFIVDQRNNRVRMVSPDGVISTVAGTGTTAGSSGDGGPATDAPMSGPGNVAVDPAGNVYVTVADRLRVLSPVLRNKNAASFGAVLAPGMIVFGEASLGIAAGFAEAPSRPWPTDLAGVSLKIIDRQQQTTPVPISFVAEHQFGYQVPDNVAIGPASIQLTTPTGATFTNTITIDRVAPGIYTSSLDGVGVAFGYWTRVLTSGAPTYGYLFDPSLPGSQAAIPVDLGSPGDQVFLSMVGTGFRGASMVTAMVGGISVPVQSFAPVDQFQGEDLVTIGPLPGSLAGRGAVDMIITFDGKPANTVTASFL